MYSSNECLLGFIRPFAKLWDTMTSKTVTVPTLPTGAYGPVNRQPQGAVATPKNKNATEAPEFPLSDEGDDEPH